MGPPCVEVAGARACGKKRGLERIRMRLEFPLWHEGLFWFWAGAWGMGFGEEASLRIVPYGQAVFGRSSVRYIC